MASVSGHADCKLVIDCGGCGLRAILYNYTENNLYICHHMIHVGQIHTPPQCMVPSNGRYNNEITRFLIFNDVIIYKTGYN